MTANTAWLLGLFFTGISLLPNAHGQNLTIGLLVKSADNEFFQLAEQGCNDRARMFNATCLFRGPLSSNPDPNGELQLQMLLDLIDVDKVDALAISVRNAAAITPGINQAIAQGIPVITFDSDAPDSHRISYVGTDNLFLGETLAKVAKQISPTGGSFCAIISDTSSNMQQRLRGFRDEMFAENKPGGTQVWRELDGSPTAYERDLDVALSQMTAFAQQDPAVMVALSGGPMFSDNYPSFFNQHARPRNITLVMADDFPVQIGYLSRGYGLGLVGQMPYEMGFRSAAALYELLQGQEIPSTIGTNLISHLQVPLVLPELVVDNELIGSLVYVGYVLFGIVFVTVAGCIGWTLYYRELSVVEAAQPVFLILVGVGVLIMGGALIPLTMDDGGDPSSLTERQSCLICMSIPWFCCCGLSIAFSALFSKLLRVNKILVAARGFQRIKVTPTDVMTTSVALLSLNVIVLSLWTAIDPLRYVREAYPGTDGWNRTLSTYGACRSRNVMRFLLPLGLIDMSVLVLANYQAYLSRKIKCEFAESKYIGIAMLSLLQALLTGFPVVFVVRDTPAAYYLVTSFMIFVVCMGLLLLIFVPKMKMADNFSRRTEQSQRRIMAASILASTTSKASQQLRPEARSNISTTRDKSNLSGTEAIGARGNVRFRRSVSLDGNHDEDGSSSSINQHTEAEATESTTL